MPELGQNFDATQQKKMGFEPIPEGEYKVMITESDIVPASTGANNSYLQLNMQILEGPEQGREYIARLNLWNTKASAVAMANKEFGAICNACNQPQCNNSDSLHNIPFIARLKIQKAKADSQYGDNNQALGYNAISGSGNGVPAQSQAPAPSPASQPAQQAPASNPAPAQQQAPAQAPAAEKPPWG